MNGLFEALGEPTRRQILELLAGGEQPAGALVEALRTRGPISQPAVSQHLRVLRTAGLVTVRAEGARRYYALDESGLRAAQGWLAGLVDPLGAFAQPLDALATEIARGHRSRRGAMLAPTPVGQHRPADPAPDADTDTDTERERFGA
ncbi:transcriptional regulator [Parafrankia colletiae]|uniref:Transcriptional regulator n=1 Tax=Parafrankia colletiae TaxID=573497 RepID=A0A1S1QZC9_9ACTN|nr:metalloregulator ArsR/SmtB family transcription factor [Parafrankia colletiae]MCK9904649.1 metalloregulator ArsR/SmtB family transcription factor [Frankia sp. Cpl3]OHV38625.1 transcriptional regulator [Parafrankia colletiae]